MRNCYGSTSSCGTTSSPSSTLTSGKIAYQSVVWILLWLSGCFSHRAILPSNSMALAATPSLWFRFRASTELWSLTTIDCQIKSKPVLWPTRFYCWYFIELSIRCVSISYFPLYFSCKIRDLSDFLGTMCGSVSMHQVGGQSTQVS